MRAGDHQLTTGQADALLVGGSISAQDLNRRLNVSAVVFHISFTVFLSLLFLVLYFRAALYDWRKLTKTEVAWTAIIVPGVFLILDGYRWDVPSGPAGFLTLLGQEYTLPCALVLGGLSAMLYRVFHRRCMNLEPAGELQTAMLSNAPHSKRHVEV